MEIDEDLIVGSHWASRYPRRFPDRRPVWQARPACPICGHPTGDCTHEQTEGLMAERKTAAAGRKPATDPVTGVPTREPGEGNDRGTPIAPSGKVHPSYEALGETGASNAHEEVAGGMPEASEAHAPQGRALDEDEILAEGFLDGGTGTVLAKKNVLVEFVPAKAAKPSTILVFPRGQTFARRLVAQRLAAYQDRPEARVIYTD